MDAFMTYAYDGDGNEWIDKPLENENNDDSALNKFIDTILRCQSFVRSLCNLQQTVYRPTMPRTFRNAYDAYFEIRQRIDDHLDRLLFKTKIGMIQKCCPCCAYKLDRESPLKPSVLTVMDGNKSLKRVKRKKDIKVDENVLSEVIKLPDSRRVSFKAKRSDTWPVEGLHDQSLCIDRWTNLAKDSKKQIWGIFEETGIFVASCRHGIMLFLCNMVRSGELAKYPLALVNELINTFGKDIMTGYDIACGFSATVHDSRLLGPKSRSADFSLCVNAFHRHVHCRKCQLRWHPLYQKGVGLEDFEGWERIFSELNRVAMCTRHASSYHRQQAIMHHFKRWNRDRFLDLSSFMYSNYCQALDNIATLTPKLERIKRQLNISLNETFKRWHEEERAYLSLVSQVPESNVLAGEYVKTLKSLNEARSSFDKVMQIWSDIPPEQFNAATFYLGDSASTRAAENARRKSLEKLTMLQTTVQALEEKLGVTERWMPDRPEWLKADKTLAEKAYLKAVDYLESLVVSCLFKLSKMNHTGTCYCQRTQIAKALKSRSQAIRTAVLKYNQAALNLPTPRTPIDMSDVLEYVFVGEFNLLRESHYDILKKPWMQPTAREAVATYFKLQRSHEKLARLTIEQRRLLVFMKDVEIEMKQQLGELEKESEQLAFQLQKWLDVQVKVNGIQRQRLAQIAHLGANVPEQDGKATQTFVSILTKITDIFEESNKSVGRLTAFFLSIVTPAFHVL
ncbi:hypothetical protein ACEPAI_1891 [Sanghuangporus weigelae]